MEEFEKRTSALEKQVASLEELVRVLQAQLEAKGGAEGKEKSEKGDKKEIEELSEEQKLQYRVKIMKRAADAKDEALAVKEEQLSKANYRIMHLQRAYDTLSKSDK